MHLIHDIPPRKSDSVYRMVVENPQGVAGKYEINKKLGCLELDRVLSAPMPFPFDYGIIPGTWCEADDDPVDIMAIMPISTFQGCVLNVRIIGMYRLVDTGEKDYKVLSVCDGDETFKSVKEISDMPKRYLQRIEFFWNNYKNLVSRNVTEGAGWSSKSAAEKYINSAIEHYARKFPSKAR